MSTRSIRPPPWSAGRSRSGICSPMRSRNVQPPLLHTYSAPSGPIAAPFGLSPGVATVSFEPSGRTRMTQPPASSTTRTLPSDIATGPSGKRSPSVISVTCGVLMRASRARPRSLEQERATSARNSSGALAVLHDVCDRRHRDAVFLREHLEIREPRGRAVVVQHFADHCNGRAAGETGEIDRRFGMTAAFDHTALACPQRKHVAGAHEVLGPGVGVENVANSERTIVGTDAAARVAMVDRYGERGVATFLAGRDHRADLELVEQLRVARHAHEPAGPPQHEVDRLGRNPLGRNGEVALILAIFVVDHEHHLASPNPAQRIVDGGECHRYRPSLMSSAGASSLTRPGIVATMRQ